MCSSDLDLLEKIEDRLLGDLQVYYQEALDSACLFKLEKDFKVEDYIHEKQNLFHFFRPGTPSPAATRAFTRP